MTGDFTEWTGKFQRFLKREGFPTRLIWVFHEEVVFLKQCMYVRRRHEAERNREAQEFFESGMTKGLGVSLEGYAISDDAIYCDIYVPKDKEEAQRHLMRADGGVKLRVCTKPLRAKSVSAPLLRVLAWFGERAGVPFQDR
jgi:hypothetical protein